MRPMRPCCPTYYGTDHGRSCTVVAESLAVGRPMAEKPGPKPPPPAPTRSGWAGEPKIIRDDDCPLCDGTGTVEAPIEPPCSCVPGAGCDAEGDPGCVYCQTVDAELPCPAEVEA